MFLADVYLPKCLLCGGFAESIVVSVMWFSSGGTKSVLHNDDVDNINCLYDGEKRLVMIDKVREYEVYIKFECLDHFFIRSFIDSHHI